MESYLQMGDDGLGFGPRAAPPAPDVEVKPEMGSDHLGFGMGSVPVETMFILRRIKGQIFGLPPTMPLNPFGSVWGSASFGFGPSFRLFW